MRYSICVVTGSRAEFGLLKPLIKRLEDDEDIYTWLVVTGSHISAECGNTIQEIEAEGFSIYSTIPVLLNQDDKRGMVLSTAKTLENFADFFADNRPDMLLVLGDRFEIFAVATAAAIMGIPIAHLCGGAVTEGAVDECFRHSISKMSCLHFTTCEIYRKRVIQLGENPENVFNVGSLGVENALRMNLLSVEELEKHLGFSLIENNYAIVTFHPVTFEEDTASQQANELIAAISEFPNYQFIITKANADAGGRAINQIWDLEMEKHDNWYISTSLGSRVYLSALKHATMVIGNSSSGIIEAPALHTPTVNIGDRQKGREMSQSIISCEPIRNDIIRAINMAASEYYQKAAHRGKSQYGNGRTSEAVLSIMKTFLQSGNIDTKKKFYNIDYKVK